MSTVSEEMDSLGKKHKSINMSVNETVRKNIPFEVVMNKCSVADIDNLYIIDVANKYRNVNYITEVLKTRDMLHISRALKHSAWLFTGDKYCNIINPQYLHSELFPYMSSVAINKLLYYVRLYVKDESRNEDFYKYYEENNELETATKWLPNCSIPFVEYVIEQHSPSLRICMFKRLCKRSFTIFEKYIKKKDIDDKFEYLQAGLFLVNTHCIEYLHILQNTYKKDGILERLYTVPFNEKYTTTILKHCPEVICSEFEKYYKALDVRAMVKYIGPVKIKDFLLTHAKRKSLFKWFTYKNLKPFIEELPEVERFAFVEEVFINNLNGDPMRDKKYEDIFIAFSSNDLNSLCVYQWYHFAPFPTSFVELKKLIMTESNPTERLAMLNVLVTLARHDITHVHKLLEYFQIKHLNEQFRFKIIFVNNLLSTANIYKVNEETWKLLDELFYNLGVYFDSENDVQKCIECIIVYKILHNQSIDKAVERKLTFHTFDYLNARLNKQDRESIFKYIYNVMENKLNKESIEDEKSFSSGVTLMHQMLNLLKQEEKDLGDYLSLLENIKNFVEIKLNRNWSTDMNVLFNVKRSWRKLMFEESLSLRRGVDACLHALKYDPTLLARRCVEVKNLHRDEKALIDRAICKIRVYWPQTLAAEWTAEYRTELQKTTPSRIAVRRLCLLSSPQELESLLREHAPSNRKIQWSEVDQTALSMRNYLAQTMYCARPPPAPNSVLLYATGDHLQYVLPSLNAVFYKLCANEVCYHLPHILSGPLALQKYGLRLAFSKLRYEELMELFLNTWNISENKTIRAVVFELTFKLLCIESNPQRIGEFWRLLAIFIDNLASEENKIIYKILGKADKVPISVRAKFCMKSYKLLKSLPPKVNCSKYLKNLTFSTLLLMDTIDSTFMSEVLMEHINDYYVEKHIHVVHNCCYSSAMIYTHNMKKVISAFILRCTDEAEQMRRYNNILVSILDHSVNMWYEIHEDEYVVKKYIKYLIHQLIIDTSVILIEDAYSNPTNLFKTLKQYIDNRFPAIENYYLSTLCGLTVYFTELYTKTKSLLVKTCEKKTLSDLDIEKLQLELWRFIAPTFGKMCFDLLAEDLEKYSLSVQRYFETILELFMQLTAPNSIAKVYVAKGLMAQTDSIIADFLIMKLLPDHLNYSEVRKEYVECRERLLSHTSLEIKMLYHRKFYDAELDM